MATIIITGRIIKDATTHLNASGKNYTLLTLAENIRKRDEKGEFYKDEKGHWVSYPTRFYSVFVNGDLASAVAGLKKGQLIKIDGSPTIDIEKGDNGYDKLVLSAVNAFKVDTEPFASKGVENAEEEAA